MFANALREKFQITVVETVEEYLGIRLETLPSGDIKLTQPKLLSAMEVEHHEALLLIRSRKVTAPQRIINHSTFESSEPMDTTEYLHLLGGLIYLTKSRPDIMTAVSFGATFANKPTRAAYQELLLCLSYLLATRDHGLILHSGIPNSPLQLNCYVDASYLTHRDSKSHTGYTLSFGTVGCFYAKSGKQSIVATSTTHAELRALYSLCVDIIYVIHLCNELHRPLTLPCIVMEDNQPVIDVTAQISTRAKRCKHFLMLVSFIREQVENGLIELLKVNSKENIADILTKIITGNEYTLKSQLLLGMV
jgi:hypothetical protein